jgi:hypothetical protein
MCDKLMRESTELFIPIPKVRNTKVKVEVAGDDLTGRVRESLWVYPVTDGIGTFRFALSNAFGQISDSYKEGDIVKFYADNKDASTIQFWGRIDHVKDDVSDNGQFLVIEGRHRAYKLTEFLVCHSALNTPTSQILKDIIDKLPESYGITYDNVSTSDDSMSVEWNYKPFWDCVIELCNFADDTRHDCYIDNDLDAHYFEENSIVNETDAVVEGDNEISSKGWGINDYYEKTRVIASGQTKEGLPIVYTAISATEGDEQREAFVKDVSADTAEKVKNLAEARLSSLTNRTPEASIKSFGLETIKPGENLSVLIPRQKVYGQYKIIKIMHKFGAKSGGWRTEIMVEQHEEDVPRVLREMDRKSDRLRQADNINKLNFSWNFDFSSDSGIHSGTEITEGVLKTDGGASGTWISDINQPSDIPTKFELRVIGQSIPGTVFYVSVDNGLIYQTIVPNELKLIELQGKNILLKVDINSVVTQIYSMVLLYS